MKQVFFIIIYVPLLHNYVLVTFYYLCSHILYTMYLNHVLICVLYIIFILPLYACINTNYKNFTIILYYFFFNNYLYLFSYVIYYLYIVYTFVLYVIDVLCVLSNFICIYYLYSLYTLPILSVYYRYIDIYTNASEIRYTTQPCVKKSNFSLFIITRLKPKIWIL